MSTTSADWSQTPERSNRVALRAMCWAALTLGRRVAHLLLVPVSLYFLLAAPGPRRNVRRYLGRVLGRPARWRDCFRLIHAFAITVVDRVYFLRGHAGRFEVRVHGPDTVLSVLTGGRGAFLMGAHVGSFDAIGHAGRLKGGMRIAMLMYPDNARQINAVLDAIAPDAERAAVIALGRPEAMLTVRDWLDGGGLAGMLVDRTISTAVRRDATRDIPFLGTPAPFSEGPFRLAALLRRPVYFMAATWAGGACYDVYFEPLADFSTPAGSAAAQDARIHRAMDAYVARVERLCREAPYNWFNFHDFWREDAQ